MTDEIFEQKQDEFKAILGPVLKNWFKNRIESSANNTSGINVFHQDVDGYLRHVHSVYDCVKKGMNPLDSWPTLPDVEHRVVKHFESKVHKIELRITNIQTSIQKQTPIIVIRSTHTIAEWIFDYEIHICNEVDVCFQSMKHNTDDNLKLYKLDFIQMKQSFEHIDLLDSLAKS